MWRKTTTGKTSSPRSQPIMSAALNFPFGLTLQQCHEEVPWGVQRVSIWVLTIVVNLWPRSYWRLSVGDRFFDMSHGGSGVLDGGGGVQFSKRLNFEFWGLILKMHKMRGGVELLRHCTGLLCKSCQTILWFKQIHVSYAHTQALKDVWYWWRCNRVCPSEGYTSLPLLVTFLMASLFYPFFP